MGLALLVPQTNFFDFTFHKVEFRESLPFQGHQKSSAKEKILDAIERVGFIIIYIYIFNFRLIIISPIVLVLP